MSDPGKLDRRLTLEEPAEIADGAGGVTRSYQAVATLWAQVVPVSARGTVDAERPGAVATNRIRILSLSDIGTRHRLREGNAIYRIVALHDPDGRGRFLLIEAEARVD
ncbi:MAG: phage head closure protein [Pseudorhodoplanes sp.]